MHARLMTTLPSSKCWNSANTHNYESTKQKQGKEEQSPSDSDKDKQCS